MQLASIFIAQNLSFSSCLPRPVSHSNRMRKVCVLCEVGVTGCEFVVARLGSIMVSSKNSRRLNVYPETHVVIAYVHQLVDDLKDAFSAIQEKYSGKLPSMVSVITGPSRTADIEKTLVMGAHGPRELFLILVETPPSDE
jgi:L-lactate dehydrogenase complex protein LldG